MKKNISLISLIVVLVLSPAFYAQAQVKPNRVKLDENTIAKGYTVSSVNSNFRIGIPAQALSSRNNVTVAIKQNIDSKNFNLKKQNLLSKLYSFDISSKNDVEVINKPVFLSLKYNKKKKGKKVIKFWNASEDKWQTLPSKKKKNRQVVKASIFLPYAVVGVFSEDKVKKSKKKKKEKKQEEEEDEQENQDFQIGYASWYDYIGAASTEYPYGSVVKVTNLDNNKSCEVTIKDYGPFVPGRVIDLPRESFESIANLGTGVVKVKVELISLP